MFNSSVVSIGELALNKNIRLIPPLKLPESNFEYISLAKVIKKCEAGSRPKGGINVSDCGQVLSIGGEQIGKDGSLKLKKTPYVSYEYYESANKGKVFDKDILLCKDGALTGKTCIVNITDIKSEKVMVNEHVYIIQGNQQIRQQFLFYYTRSTLFQNQVKDLAFRKKGQPGLNYDHINQIKIPDIPIERQDEILSKCDAIESKIQELKKKKINVDSIINNAFNNYLSLNINEVLELDKKKSFSISTSSIAYKNGGLRTSYRWNKLYEIQQILYTNIKEIHKLGAFSLNTKNGWSPNCNEGATENCVLGIDSINDDGLMSFDNIKYTDETRANIESFYVKKGDFFVSRGNTTDLVAMASIIFEDLEKNYIFPDLMIRLEFDKNRINSEYLAFVFNSIIGRLYFKYVSKGKNQTMVKISSDELHNFLLPIPSYEEQCELVMSIRKEINHQKEIDLKIELLRRQIDHIILKEMIRV